jgi:hypothetical protein
MNVRSGRRREAGHGPRVDDTRVVSRAAETGIITREESCFEGG